MDDVIGVGVGGRYCLAINAVEDWIHRVDAYLLRSPAARPALADRT